MAGEKSRFIQRPALWEDGGLLSRGRPPPPSLTKRQVRSGRTKERFRDGSESAVQRKGETGQAIPGKKALPRGWFLSGVRVDLLQM